jgi:hypothetical protein
MLGDLDQSREILTKSLSLSSSKEFKLWRESIEQVMCVHYTHVYVCSLYECLCVVLSMQCVFIIRMFMCGTEQVICVHYTHVYV